MTENIMPIGEESRSSTTTGDVKLSSFGLARLFSAVDISAATWLLTEERLETPPSLGDGVSAQLERELRFLGCELIQAASILLRLPQVAAATAQILFQRYFCAKSFVRNNFEHVAMGCLMLASKIEEAPRRARDVINVFHHMKQLSYFRGQKHKKPTPMILDQDYVKLKTCVIKAERRVLNVLGFCVHVKHPHKLLTVYLRTLECEENGTLRQRACNVCPNKPLLSLLTLLLISSQQIANYMNDGLRMSIFMRYPVETIACACIFLAARVLEVPLPEDERPWWELFGASEKDIFDIARTLTGLYLRQKSPSWGRIEREVEALKQTQLDAQRAKSQLAALATLTPKKDETSPFVETNSQQKTPPSSTKKREKEKETSRRSKESSRGRRDGKSRSRRSRSRSSADANDAAAAVESDDSAKRLPKWYNNSTGKSSSSSRGRSREKRPKRRRSRSADKNGAAEKEKKRRRDGDEKAAGRDRHSRKDKEREVMRALGKTHRSRSPPPPPPPPLLERKVISLRSIKYK